MSVLIRRWFWSSVLAAVIPLSVLGQSPSPAPQPNSSQTTPAQTAAAPIAQEPPLQGTPAGILHTQGGVWVNGSEARDSTAVFAGDIIETKPNFSATLNLEGSEILLAPESVVKFDADTLELDHGSVSVGTSRGFKVRLNCIVVAPASSEWTQYEVSNVTGMVQVVAHKRDVNVDHGSGKDSTPQTAPGGALHEGEQKGFDESEICGRPAQPVSAGGTGLNAKWIAAGAAGAGLLIWLLIHNSGGGGQNNMSQSTP
jgi:hypothetical protein